MRKVLLVTMLAAAAGSGWAQTASVPPDYPAQASQLQSSPVDAQIEAVRRNYEDVKARAQVRLDAERRAQAERQAQQAQEQAREKARAQAAAEARAKEAARKAGKKEAFDDEQRKMQLEMQRLDLRAKQSDIELKEAINREKVRRANEIVEKQLNGEGAAR